MYCEFYGFKTPPFTITNDPQFFYESLSHRDALATLAFGIKEKKGIILLTGEVGTGKTMLCKTVLDHHLGPQVKVSFILNPCFSDGQLLQAIVEDFGLRVEKKNRLDIMRSLNKFLIDINIKGGNAVLMIDEAQNLSSRQLEQVRLLSNLETAKEKLLQIVLVGQPELVDKLNQFRLRQIRQRISVKHDIAPLKVDEVKAYIELRLKKAGKASAKFLPESYDVIYEFSKGVPRLINLLCDRTLLIGFVMGKKVFDGEMLKASVKEIA